MVATQLALDALMLEGNLETAINANQDAATKIDAVKKTLKELVINEMMITKFRTLITKTTEPTTQNG